MRIITVEELLGRKSFVHVPEEPEMPAFDPMNPDALAKDPYLVEPPAEMVEGAKALFIYYASLMRAGFRHSDAINIVALLLKTNLESGQE